MASKKKRLPNKKQSSEVSFVSMVAATGAWVAVVDAKRAFEVAVWASTKQGVIGLVSMPGLFYLAYPDGCIGYVQRREDEDGRLEDVHNAAARYFDDNFESQEPEDDEDPDDEDLDPEDESD